MYMHCHQQQRSQLEVGILSYKSLRHKKTYKSKVPPGQMTDSNASMHIASGLNIHTITLIVA
jgi:hypothetical protein